MLEDVLSWTGIRYANAGLSFLVVAGLVASLIRRWDGLPLPIKRIAPWIITTYAIIAYGNIEIARADVYVPPGLRVVLLFGNLIGLALTLLYNLAEHTEPGDPPRRVRDELDALLHGVRRLVRRKA